MQKIVCQSGCPKNKLQTRSVHTQQPGTLLIGHCNLWHFYVMYNVIQYMANDTCVNIYVLCDYVYFNVLFSLYNFATVCIMFMRFDVCY